MLKTGRNQHDLLFYLAFALLICHELDAVARHEWRLLPVLSQLADPLAQDIFVLAHIPLIVILLWATCHANQTLQQRSRFAVSIFLIGHAVAHYAFSNNQLYEFEAPVETITVYGAATVSVFYLLFGRNTKL